MQYGGRHDLSDPAKGLIPYVGIVFETGDPRYSWLNRIQAVGKGVLAFGPDGTRIDYEICELR